MEFDFLRPLYLFDSYLFDSFVVRNPLFIKNIASNCSWLHVIIVNYCLTFISHSWCLQQGVIIFHDVFDNKHNVGGAQIRVEGVYIWPFRKLRMVANR